MMAYINSDFLNGLNKEDAINKMLEFLKEKGIGEKKINYKFREWIFARQRYWGEPVPVVHMEDGTIHALDDKELPLVLPVLDDYKGHNGKAPLENASEWKKYQFNGKNGLRETSTMPGSAGSSWYFLRYVDPKMKIHSVTRNSLTTGYLSIYISVDQNTQLVI